jgi:PPOX class probable FMN-dependent enzyme
MATISGITSVDELRELIGSPQELVVSKIAPKLNDLTRQFIERSPFMCLATSAPDGQCDVSPRGDPSGFVRILDERTLLIPDRPGNKLADSLRNILANPHVGLLFLVPGIGDTFRVNGRATLVTDPELLAASEIEGKPPKLGIMVEIDECYTQCSKALIRSDLWNPEQHIDRSELPSSGQIMRAVREEETFDADEYDKARAERYARREGLY